MKTSLCNIPAANHFLFQTADAMRFEMEQGEYWVLPATFNAGENGPFTIAVMADKPVEFVPDN